MSVATGPCTRHYNSDLSIWLSVDPMSDKYPSTSPYAYCANNPVRMVDPDGRDIYEFDKKGNLINTIENTDNDIIRVVNKRGKVLFESMPYEYGTIIEAASDDSKPDKIILSIKDNESRIKIFEELAYHTKVEWMTIHAEKDLDKKNYISTSRSDDHGASLLPYRLKDEGYTATECSHSHPKHFFGGNFPSGYGFYGDKVKGGDKLLFFQLKKMWRNIDVKVFDANNGHYYRLGPLPETVIEIDREGNEKPFSK